MSIDVISHITRGKHARHAGVRRLSLGAGMNGEIAALHVELPGKQIGIGFVANGDENAGKVDLLLLRAFQR